MDGHPLTVRWKAAEKRLLGQVARSMTRAGLWRHVTARRLHETGWVTIILPYDGTTLELGRYTDGRFVVIERPACTVQFYRNLSSALETITYPASTEVRKRRAQGHEIP